MDRKSMRIVGIDVSKRFLDVAFEGVAAVEQIANTPVAIAALVAGLQSGRDLVVFERTGGYERVLEAMLAQAEIAFSLIHTMRVKAYRSMCGIKAKTDKIDARLLMMFARDRLDADDLRLGRLEDVTMDALMARQRQLKAALHAERCRLETAQITVVRASVERMIAQLLAELAAIETELRAQCAADPQLAFKQQVLEETIGVARQTARALLAEMPELGRLDRKEAAALGNLAPRTHRSGTIQRQRGVAPGRSAVKVILFYPARTAMRWDPGIKAFSARLRARGKHGNVILVAVMRKLLVRLNARLRDALAGVQHDALRAA